MALTRSIRQALGTVWGGVVSAVMHGRDLFSYATAQRRAYEQQGLPSEPAGPGVIDYMGQVAGSWDQARTNIAQANPSDAVTSAMTALALWSKPLDEQNVTPSWHIILGIKVEGQEQLVYRTVTGITRLPATVGELKNLAYANAVAMSAATTAAGGVGGTVTSVAEIIPTVGPSGG